MATQDVVVRIRAEIGSFKKDMDAASAKAKETAKKTEEAGKSAESGIGRLAQTANAHEKAWDQVSNGMLAGGAAVVGALALSTKAAIEWESAWAGVTKTVDGSPEQMAQLEGELRNLARTLPSTHTEIAAVAEAAGQLGVAREDVSGFTKTMIDLGESTNLTAEDAATNIAQISNVMGTMNREGAEGVQRFGSALVALGNDGASTESDILSMAQRIAGVGATVGATETDVLALSNTLASMGVRAELGGGVASRVLLKMRTAADEGGDSLEAFAQTAGLSADEFAAKFRESPVQALDLVTKGINRVNESGGNVTATLKEMGIKGTEESQVMLALANSGDLLSDSLELGSQAWSANTALVDEANKRYETAASKIKIAWNNIKDSAIDAGAVLLPAVAGIADVVADLAGVFSDLPGPVQNGIVALAGIAGVSALVAGALGKIIPGVVSTVSGLRDLKTSLGGMKSSASSAAGSLVTIDAALTRTQKSARGMAKAGKVAANGLLALVAVGPAIGSMVSSGDLANLDELQATLLGTGDVMGTLNEQFTGKGNWFDGLDVGGIEAAFKVMKDPSVGQNIDQVVSKVLTLGTRGSSNFEFAKKNFEQLDSTITAMVKGGNADKAAEAYEQIASSASNAGIPVEELADLFPQYSGALKLAAAEGENADFAGVAGELGEVGDSAEDTTQAINDFYAALVNTGMVVLSEREALRGMEESFAAASASIEENGRTLDITTEKGRANQEALDGIASATLRAMEAQQEAGATAGELGATIEEGREAFINNAVAMGMSGEAAAALADQMNLIPGAVYIQFDSNTDDLAGKLTEIHELVQTTPDGSVTITENSPVVISALEDLGYVVTTLPDGKIKVSETGTDATGKKIDATAAKKRMATIDSKALTRAADKALDNVAKDRTATVTAVAKTWDAMSSLERLTRPLSTSITVRKTITESVNQISNGPVTGQFGKANGGRAGLPGFTNGGQLPDTGLGTDQILGVNSQGNPVAWVDDREWIINGKSSDKFNGILSAINKDDPAVQHLAGFANGGRVSSAEKRVKSAQKAYSSIDGTKANRVRKLAAKDQLEAAKEDLKSAKAEAKATAEANKKAAEARKEERERQSRISEERFNLNRDIKRGDITDSFTSGSGMSVVDRLFEQSKNKDLSRGKRSSLRSTAYGMESQLLSLEKRSESLTTKLDKAKEARDRLLEVSKSVASGLRGEYSLGGVIDNLVDSDFKGTLTAKSFVKSAQGKARQIRMFGEMLEKLRKRGFNEAIIQEIADLGTSEGTQVGNALLGASGKERDALNNAYKSMDYWSGQAGDEVTKSMQRGGIDAAEGLVRGLEGKTKDVESAFYKLGKSAEKAFRRSLDMHSPSRTMAVGGADSIDGIIVGAEAKRKSLIDTYASMGSDVASAYSPSLATAVPPSPEVSRYASATAVHMSGQPGVPISDLRSALAGMTFELNGNAGKLIAKIVDAEVQSATRSRKSIYK